MVIIEANTVRLLVGDGIRFLSSPKLYLQIGNCWAFKVPRILQATLNIVDFGGNACRDSEGFYGGYPDANTQVFVVVPELVNVSRPSLVNVTL